MDALPLIPTPTSQKWKEFRLQGLPVIVFLICLATSAWLWSNTVATATLVGAAESNTATVTSPHTGSLRLAGISRHDHVTAGQLIGHVVTTQPQVLEASLAVIRAEVELIRAGLQPAVDQQRNAMAWEQLRLQLISERTQLASARVQYQYAETEFERIARLYQDRIASDNELDIARRNRDTFKAEIDERERAIADLAPALASLGEVGNVPGFEKTLDPIRAAIKVQEEKLKLTEAQLSPIPIVAPIEGSVDFVLKHSGENVAAGEQILSIVPEHPRQIVAYLHQPPTIDPVKGMTVEIMTRSATRTRATSRISSVGAQWEPVSRSLLRPGTTFEVGLPILVSIPPDLKIRPGELVDLTIRPATATP